MLRSYEKTAKDSSVSDHRLRPPQCLSRVQLQPGSQLYSSLVPPYLEVVAVFKTAAPLHALKPVQDPIEIAGADIDRNNPDSRNPISDCKRRLKTTLLATLSAAASAPSRVLK